MISQETIEKILEATRIDEVVGDFVQLKKRASTLVGLCPFHDEKTPSFSVSVSKGIYKCFGCNKGGDAVRFIMEQANYSYPEALRYLANKYHIEIIETARDEEQSAVNDHRESLFIVSAWASRFFQENLLQANSETNIGALYLRERGFGKEVIQKFELGYSPNDWDILTKKAIEVGFQEEVLLEAGLSIRHEKGTLYDRFRDRVIFPIHNLFGKTIGFGGRALQANALAPKYLNSPESKIYHKSSVLYGLYQAKKSIKVKDCCYLVEGYADVLAMHQAGIENVVASAGTSLTSEQIKLISRFTQNVVLLYDGDQAGIRASLRGLDMILAEGLNVKILSFPEGHDPDSYCRKVGGASFLAYIEDHQEDFIVYKANALLMESEGDPMRKAELVRSIISSIAHIPDGIKASLFVRKCSSLMQIEEQVLLAELNKIKVNKASKEPQVKAAPQLEDKDGAYTPHASTVQSGEAQEEEVIRILLNYGHEEVTWDGISNLSIASYMISNLNDVQFEGPIAKSIFDIYKVSLEQGELPQIQRFIRHEDPKIVEMAISLVSSPYALSENWQAKRKIYVRKERENLRTAVLGAIFHLKKRKIDGMLKGIRKEIQQEQDPQNQAALMQHYMRVKEVEKGISAFLGSVVLK